jgi:hypothetical protein
MSLEQFNSELDRLSTLPEEDYQRESEQIRKKWRMPYELKPDREEKFPKIKWKGSYEELDREVERLSKMSPEDADREIDRMIKPKPLTETIFTQPLKAVARGVKTGLQKFNRIDS